MGRLTKTCALGSITLVFVVIVGLSFGDGTGQNPAPGNPGWYICSPSPTTNTFTTTATISTHGEGPSPSMGYTVRVEYLSGGSWVAQQSGTGTTDDGANAPWNWDNELDPPPNSNPPPDDEWVDHEDNRLALYGPSDTLWDWIAINFQ